MACFACGRLIVALAAAEQRVGIAGDHRCIGGRGTPTRVTRHGRWPACRLAGPVSYWGHTFAEWREVFPNAACVGDQGALVLIPPRDQLEHQIGMTIGVGEAGPGYRVPTAPPRRWKTARAVYAASANRPRIAAALPSGALRRGSATTSWPRRHTTIRCKTRGPAGVGRFITLRAATPRDPDALQHRRVAELHQPRHHVSSISRFALAFRSRIMAATRRLSAE